MAKLLVVVLLLTKRKIADGAFLYLKEGKIVFPSFFIIAYKCHGSMTGCFKLVLPNAGMRVFSHPF
jgi:hypothetical protein